MPLILDLDKRRFNIVTNVQEDVMEFVNSIAKIVHMEVSLHGGAPNKNIGDAFLLVWKLPKGFTSRDIPRLKDLPKLPAQSSLSTQTPEPVEHGRDSNTNESQDLEGDWKDRESGTGHIRAFRGARPVSLEGSPSKSTSGKVFELAITAVLAS